MEKGIKNLFEKLQYLMKQTKKNHTHTTIQ